MVTLEFIVAIQVHPEDNQSGRGNIARVKVMTFTPLNPYNREQA